jgi:hypothetical protein
MHNPAAFMSPVIWSFVKGVVLICGFSAVLIVLLELRERNSFSLKLWLKSGWHRVKSKLGLMRNVRGPRLGKWLSVSNAIKRIL